jgi:hypothetical protein
MRFAIDIIDPEADIRPNAKKKWFDPQTALRALEKRDIGLLIADPGELSGPQRVAREWSAMHH